VYSTFGGEGLEQTCSIRPGGDVSLAISASAQPARGPAPALPAPRGPISAAVLAALRSTTGPVLDVAVDGIDMLGDDDAQLALWCCYQLHYSSFAGVDDDWEWSPALLALRAQLERQFVARLVDEIGPPVPETADAVAPGMLDLAQGNGPSLSRYLAERGTRSELRQFLVHRSLYQRKEADAHTWAIPRLRGRAKAAMVTIQYDEYGAGVASAMHAELFATTMLALGLDPSFGAYVNFLPATTLATDNLVTMFGLHRRWRAACVGHLALFEMTSVEPMGRYANALQRLGVEADARRFYQVHVDADVVHQQIALDDMVAGLVADDPATAGDVLFGARALVAVEQRFAAALLNAWARARSSLRGVSLPEQRAS
jgi:hypothetical protein